MYCSYWAKIGKEFDLNAAGELEKDKSAAKPVNFY